MKFIRIVLLSAASLTGFAALPSIADAGYWQRQANRAQRQWYRQGNQAHRHWQRQGNRAERYWQRQHNQFRREVRQDMRQYRGGWGPRGAGLYLHF